MKKFLLHLDQDLSRSIAGYCFSTSLSRQRLLHGIIKDWLDKNSSEVKDTIKKKLLELAG